MLTSSTGPSFAQPSIMAVTTKENPSASTEYSSVAKVSALALSTDEELTTQSSMSGVVENEDPAAKSKDYQELEAMGRERAGALIEISTGHAKTGTSELTYNTGYGDFCFGRLMDRDRQLAFSDEICNMDDLKLEVTESPSQNLVGIKGEIVPKAP